MQQLQTTETRCLDAAQIAAFKRDGFVFVPGFYSADEIARITDWTDEVTAWPEEPGRHMVYYEDSLKTPGARVVQRIEYFTQFHDGFGGLFTDGRMQAAVSDLLGEEAVLLKIPPAKGKQEWVLKRTWPDDAKRKAEYVVASSFHGIAAYLLKAKADAAFVEGLFKVLSGEGHDELKAAAQGWRQSSGGRTH